MSSERPAVDDLLTPREREVLEYLRLELTNEQIADELGISANGVKYHVSEILGKLGVRNRKEAARWPEPRPWWAGALAPAAFVWRRAALVLPKPSALALVVSGGAIAVALGGLGFMAFLLIQGGGQAGETRLVSSDPDVLIAEALREMEGLDSYHVRFSFPPQHPDDVRGESDWELEFEAPDKYRVLMYGAEGATEERCESLDDGRNGEVCYEVMTKITSTSVAEGVYVGGRAYSRVCEDRDVNCGPWREEAAAEPAFFGPSPTYHPVWPLVALEMAGGLAVAGNDNIDGLPAVRVGGSVNHMRAILENQRRVLDDAGITTFGTECTSEAMPVRLDETGEVLATPGPSPTDVCRDLTYEESLESQEPGLSYYDEHPATVDAWISRADGLIRRVEFDIPPEDGRVGAQLFTIEYSLFNEVEIEAPR